MDAAAPAVTAAPQGQDPRRLVLKNTLVLLLGQLIGAPLNIWVTLVMGRELGADFYGGIYLVTAWTTFGWLFVEWGQGPVVSGEIARDRSRGGELLGSSLVFRVATSLLAYAVLAIWFAHDARNALPQKQIILLLISVQCLLLTVNNLNLEAVKGLERMDVSAYQNVLQPLFSLLFIMLVLKYLHLGVRAALLAQNAVYLLIFVYVWRARRQVGIKPLRFRLQTLKELFRPGTAFLIFNLAMAAQPFVDALMLQYMKVPLNVVGWNAAARRLIGPLILPASVLIGALYPTLSRLHVEDKGAFATTLRSAVKGTLILAFPIGLGCALFADLGVMLFGPKFQGSQMNLKYLAPYVFLMYFSMPLGIAVLASQRQKTWAAVQSLCVVVSLVLDPILIPVFQRLQGNGGLGVCVAAVVSEGFMVAGGAWLAPKGTFDRGFALSLVRCLVAGGAMAGFALLCRRLPVHMLIVAPVSVAVYFGALWAVGGLKNEQLAGLVGGLKRKLARR
jgi:O-antigen/teichoic acid export membrane protein